MSKSLKALGYIFFISAIVWVLLRFINTSSIIKIIAQYFCLFIMVIIMIIFLVIFFYCKKDNQKIDELIALNKYQELISYANMKKEKNILFIADRKYYYDYLIILSYFCLDDLEKMKETIYNFPKPESFPMINFWKSCLEFSNNQFENIQAYYEAYYNDVNIRKNVDRYANFINILYSFNMFVNNDLPRCKTYYDKIDKEKVSMNVTLRALNVLKEKIDEYDEASTQN
ncbi:MAG: hypothetical protein MR270_00035 [Erysipelotrichaceae bacterium]|nr:hypothetical protein [Erysipelotrichaceae bacterium]